MYTFQMKQYRQTGAFISSYIQIQCQQSLPLQFLNGLFRQLVDYEQTALDSGVLYIIQKTKTPSTIRNRPIIRKKFLTEELVQNSSHLLNANHSKNPFVQSYYCILSYFIQFSNYNTKNSIYYLLYFNLVELSLFSPIRHNTQYFINNKQDNNRMREQQGQVLSLSGSASQRKQKSFGKLKVLFHSQYFHISLGPDYLFFLCGLVGFLLLSFTLAYVVLLYAENWRFLVGSLLMACFTPGTYLWTGLSNPGIYDAGNNLDTKTKYCNRCRVFIPKKCYHCNRCDVCIEGYDHHCPWSSKCIGKGNILAFYVFIISVPISIIYTWASLAICLTPGHHKINTQNLTTHPHP